MKITVLNDNAPGKFCLAEYGLSLWVEADKHVLFDTGYTNVFQINADRLGIHLNSANAIVLSHGHWDHGNGLKYISGGNLIAHPGVFSKRFNRRDKRYIGIDISQQEAEEKFTVTLSKTPVQISPEIIYLGEIPRLNNFEAQNTNFEFENGASDYVNDDSALVVKTPQGLVVISGCAHAGICNTVEYAMQVTGNCDVLCVFGGFHLRNDKEQTIKTIEYLKSLKVKFVYPSHCTSLPALALFYEAFGIHQVLTGDFFHFG